MDMGSLSMSIQAHIIATGIDITIPLTTITTSNNQSHMYPRMITVTGTEDITAYLLCRSLLSLWYVSVIFLMSQVDSFSLLKIQSSNLLTVVITTIIIIMGADIAPVLLARS